MSNERPPEPKWDTPSIVFLATFYIILLLYIFSIILNVNDGVFLKEGENNKFRTFFEIMSFISTAVAVPGVAIWAVFFAKKQAIEAERARLAAVYLEVTKRWGEDDLILSRRLFQEAKRKFIKNQSTDLLGFPVVGGPFYLCSEYIAYCFMSMRRTNRDKLFPYIRILTYFEDLGVLCRQGYIRKEIILDFISGTIIEIIDLAIDYIKAYRRLNQPPGEPDTASYANLLWLYRQAKLFEETGIYREGDSELPIKTTAPRAEHVQP